MITLSKVPYSLRGDLTKWCQEIQTGVYVGNVNARIRERLWQRINENIGNGEATLVFNTNNELGYSFRTTRKDKKIIDADGIPLMMSLFQDSSQQKHGFSNAYHYHRARLFQKTKHSIKGSSEKKFIVLDLETTGTNPSRDQILSIGAVKYENGKINSFYRLVKIASPEKIPEKIVKLTGISKDLLLREGVNLKKALLDLRNFVKDFPLIGFNIPFDEQFIRVALLKNNLPQLTNKVVDLLALVKRNDKFLDNYHLRTVLEKYGIRNERPHNALSDASATMKLASKLIEKKKLGI